VTARELGVQLCRAKAKQLIESSKINLEQARDHWSRGDLDRALECYESYLLDANEARKFAGRAAEIGGVQ
jgi:hypothetical protein